MPTKPDIEPEEAAEQLSIEMQPNFLVIVCLHFALTFGQPLDYEEIEVSTIEPALEQDWTQIQTLVQDLEQSGAIEPIVVTDVAFTLCGQQGCEDTKETFDKPETVLQVAESLGRSTFTQLVQKYGLDQELSQSGPFTVFAPSNQAFEAINKTLEIMSDEDVLRLLKGHVIAEYLRSDDLLKQRKFISLNGGVLEFRQDQNGLFIYAGSGLKVEMTFFNVVADNGVVNEVDQVII